MSVITGCGGSGAIATQPTLQQLAGDYHGTWSRPSNGATGEVDLTIAADGTLSGSCLHSRYGASTGVSGQIRAGGKIDVLYRYPLEDTELPLVEPPEGTLRLESGTALLGTLRMNIGDFDTNIVYDLTKE